MRPDLGSFCRLDELGLQVVSQRLEPGRAVLACRVVETDVFARCLSPRTIELYRWQLLKHILPTLGKD